MIVEKFAFIPIANDYNINCNIDVTRKGDFICTNAAIPITKIIPSWTTVDIGYLTGTNLPTKNITLGTCLPWGGTATTFALLFYPHMEDKPRNLIQAICHWGVEPTDRWFHINSTIII